MLAVIVESNPNAKITNSWCYLVKLHQLFHVYRVFLKYFLKSNWETVKYQTLRKTRKVNGKNVTIYQHWEIGISNLLETKKSVVLELWKLGNVTTGREKVPILTYFIFFTSYSRSFHPVESCDSKFKVSSSK